MKFYGSDSEVSLERNGEREFSAFTWLPLEEVAAQVRACRTPCPCTAASTLCRCSLEMEHCSLEAARCQCQSAD